MGTSEFTAGGNPAMDQHPIQGGVEILLVASCYGNRDKLQPDGTLGSYTDFLSQTTSIPVYLILEPHPPRTPGHIPRRKRNGGVRWQPQGERAVGR